MIDDLVATGGTLISTCDLLCSMGKTVVECACVVELKVGRQFKYKKVYHIIYHISYIIYHHATLNHTIVI